MFMNDISKYIPTWILRGLQSGFPALIHQGKLRKGLLLMCSSVGSDMFALRDAL